MQFDSVSFEAKLDALYDAFDYPKEGLRDVGAPSLSSSADTHQLQFGLLHRMSKVQRVRYRVPESGFNTEKEKGGDCT